MNDLLVVVPSRGRPGNIARLAEAMQETCRGDTTLLVGLDEDDTELPAYLGINTGQLDIEVRSGLRQVVAWINHLAIPSAQRFRAIGHFGDDNIPRTVGWDVRIMEALERTPFAFGNDLYPGRPAGSLCCHVFMRSQVVETLGYFGPPCFRHMYVDPVWMAWGQAVGITFLEDVILEHLHYSSGGSQFDETYQASLACNDGDQETFRRYMNDPEGFNADVAKLQGMPWNQETIEVFRQNLNIPKEAGANPPWCGGD